MLFPTHLPGQLTCFSLTPAIESSGLWSACCSQYARHFNSTAANHSRGCVQLRPFPPSWCQGKLSSHPLACRSVGIDFIPLVADTLGGVAEGTKFIIRSIDQAIGQRAASTELPIVPDISFFVWPFPPGEAI